MFQPNDAIKPPEAHPPNWNKRKCASRLSGSRPRTGNPPRIHVISLRKLGCIHINRTPWGSQKWAPKSRSIKFESRRMMTTTNSQVYRRVVNAKDQRRPARNQRWSPRICCMKVILNPWVHEHAQPEHSRWWDWTDKAPIIETKTRYAPASAFFRC